MRLAKRRIGFTLLELMIAALVLALMTFISWELLRGGLLQTTTSSEHLSAIQSAMILMESIQEDCRQIAILNEGANRALTAPLLHQSLEFSKNGKSIMFRKSSRTNARGDDGAGSAFTVVVYQLVKRMDKQDAFAIRRLERLASGAPAPSAARNADNRAFAGLMLKDIRWDFVTRLEGMALFRTFLRVSLTVVNDAPGAGQNPGDTRNPKYFFLSNVFEIESPEPLHSTSQFAGGFAQNFVKSNRWVFSPDTIIKAGDGYLGTLPPDSWPNRTRDWTSWDYVEGENGPAKNLPTPATPNALDDPFEPTGFTAPQIRKEFITSSTNFLREILTADFRGRVTGKISGRSPRGVPPPWVEPYTIDCADEAKENVAQQINKVLDRIIPHGPEAVCEMGHALRASMPTAKLRKQPPPYLIGLARDLITTDQAQLLIQGQ